MIPSRLFPLFVLMFASFTLSAAPVLLPIHGWATWKRAENGGVARMIQPDGEYEHGAIQFVPDEDQEKIYSLEAYGHVLVSPSEKVSVKITFRTDEEVNTGTQVMLNLEAKDTAENWYRTFKEPIQETINAIPGTQQLIELTADLKAANAENIKYLVPAFVVSNLKSGSVTLLSVEVEKSESTYVAPKAPEGPGLPGFIIQKNALKRFAWSGPVETEKFNKLMDYAALGLNLIELHPENQAVAWQWPAGDTLLAEFANGEWHISAGRTPDNLSPVLTVNSERLTAAAYGSGVIFRGEDGQNHLVEGGMDSEGMTLLHASRTPDCEVRQLYIADDACSLCWIEEAQREIARAETLFAANLDYIHEMWTTNPNDRKWEITFAYYKKSLAEMSLMANERTEGFGLTLAANPVLRDRYNHLVWMAAREFPEEMGYFGGIFGKTWFSHLGGAGPITESFEFARKCDQLVARARRVAAANFREGVSAGKIIAAGWTNSLSHVFRKAGNNARLSSACTVGLARGEAQDLQLVITTAGQDVHALYLTATADSADAPALQFYRTEYITAIPSSMPQLPLCYVGDEGIPDVLIPLADGEYLSLAAYTNLPVQARLRIPRDTAPGEYNYTITIRTDGCEAIALPCTVKVHGFAIPERPLPNIGGMRPSTLAEWYPEKVQEARRNLSREMLDCLLEPIDLYSQTPALQDLEWGLEEGVKGWNFGGNLNALADPEPGMLKFLRLFGSTDGRKFTEIPATFTLQNRDETDPLSDVDLIVEPKSPVAEYRYLKLHDSEVRSWSRRCNYSFFCVYSVPGLGSAVDLTYADGTVQSTNEVTFLQPDTNPVATGTADFAPRGSLNFDSLRDASNRGSVLFEKGDGEVKTICLRNRIKQVYLEGMGKFYQKYEELASGKAEISIYGFDEVEEFLNERLISALKNTKLAFPEVRTISTASNPDANPEIFDLLDVHCPANVYAVPRFNKRMHDEHGIDYWTYVGGGGYYPFGNFERADQPLVNSRAFFWEPIAFDHIRGFLYWDIHMWRNNTNLKASLPVDWSLWNDTHGDNNGMGALFYPGPEARIYPSRRAHAMRDGIEDFALYQMARDKIAEQGNPQELADQLAEIRENFSTGMSVFNHDAESVQQNRQKLLGLLELLYK